MARVTPSRAEPLVDVAVPGSMHELALLKRSQRSGDITGMKTFAMPGRRWATEWVALTPHLFAWQVTCFFILLMGSLRLFSERSRRKTLVAVLTTAPAGSVIVQAGWLGGPAMWIQLGAGDSPTKPVLPGQSR
ncbi:hypothetical protein ABIA33_007704 [Streptacidiphilus sp. MAP12-16]